MMCKQNRTQSLNSTALTASTIETPLGLMVAVSSDKTLLLLEFTDQSGIEDAISRVEGKIGKQIIWDESGPISTVRNELAAYFEGTLTVFTTPISFEGTRFHNKVWQSLQTIPYGTTRSYLDIAKAIGNPSSSRAVGGANGKNPLAIVVPCHRVINSNGDLGGYASGLARKKFLLAHEQLYRT